MLLSKAVEGFLLDMQSGQYAISTIKLYDFTLHSLTKYLEDPPVENVRLEDLSRFMAELQSRKPPLSGPYLDNHWKSIRTFFRWCNDALGIERPDTNLPRPRYKFAEIVPYNEAEIKRMLQACEYSREFKREKTKAYRLRRATGLRDKTILLVLLDTGIRVGELCRLEIRDVNLESGEVLIRPYGTGRKTRSRVVYLGKVARRSVWLYLAKGKDSEPDDRLFPIPPTAIRSWMRELEERAQVTDVHPHRFRHTFAIQYLRNGGDVFTLQRLLGHATLDMVRRYVALAEADVASAHKKASPADRWKL
jgi:integrase/recombinase XerD